MRASAWLLWQGVSCALLFAAFAVIVLGMYGLGVVSAGSEANTLGDRVMTVVYFRVVFFKGLLPQLALAIALWPLLRRWLPALAGNAAREVAGLALAALVAYSLVAPTLLSADLPGWPALQMRRLDHQLGSALGSVAAVLGAALAGRRLVFGRAAGVAKRALAVSQS